MAKKTGKRVSNKGYRGYINLTLLLLIFVLDRLAKIYLSDSCLWLFCVKRAVNEGAAFGLLTGWITFLIAFAILILGIILWVYRNANDFARLGLVLVASGTLSNLFDRVVYGKVLDVFSFFGSSSFNLADLSNLAGVFILILSLYGYGSRRKQ